MQARTLATSLVVVWLSGGQIALADPAGIPGAACGLASFTTIGALQGELARRAVEAVSLAGRGGALTNPQLKALVTADAMVDLGAGDVGRPLGSGAEGLRALAAEMNADAYRFQRWTYIPTPVRDACGQQDMTVEFSANKGAVVYPVKFSFLGGRIVAAGGWTEAFQAGSMPPITSARPHPRHPPPHAPAPGRR